MTVGKRKYYLTANIFYEGVHFAVRKKVVEMAKMYLRSEINPSRLPMMDKIKLTLEFHTMDQEWDLDNREFFWKKMVLDLIKKKCIPEDNVKHVVHFETKYKRAHECLIVRIDGVINNGR